MNKKKKESSNQISIAMPHERFIVPAFQTYLQKVKKKKERKTRINISC